MICSDCVEDAGKERRRCKESLLEQVHRESCRIGKELCGDRHFRQRVVETYTSMLGRGRSSLDKLNPYIVSG